MASFLKLDKEKAAKVSNGGAYITESGCYDVTIGAITVDINDKGARSIGAYISLDGETYQMLYGALPLDLNDGSQELTNHVDTFQRMMAVLGIDETGEPETAELPVGKEGAIKEVLILEPFSDQKIKLWIQVQYNKGKDGSIYESRIIKDAFHIDTCASADEIINDTEPGVKYGKREAVFKETKYKNTTAEEIKTWVEAGRPKKGATTGNVSAPTPKFGASKFKK